MRKELEMIEEIELYLEGKMAGTEKTGFEKRLAADPAFKELLEEQSALVEAVHQQSIRLEIKAAHLRYIGKALFFGKFRIGLSVVLTVVTLSGISFTTVKTIQVRRQMVSAPSSDTLIFEGEKPSAPILPNDSIPAGSHFYGDSLISPLSMADTTQQGGELKVWEGYIPGKGNELYLSDNCRLIVSSTLEFRDAQGNKITENVMVVCTKEGKCSMVKSFGLPPVSWENPQMNDPLYRVYFTDQDGQEVSPVNNNPFTLEGSAGAFTTNGSVWTKANAFSTKDNISYSRVPAGYEISGQVNSEADNEFELYVNSEGNMLARQILNDTSYSILLTPAGPFWDLKTYPPDTKLITSSVILSKGSGSRHLIPGPGYFVVCLPRYGQAQ